MNKLLYIALFSVLFFSESCKDRVSGCIDPIANNYNPVATLNEDCCYNCYTSLGYNVGEYCDYNLDFILENEFTGLIQCFSVNGDIVPASTQEGVAIFDDQGEPVFWPYASFNIYCN
tara:strand:- start:95 stop:445 length:351 start_codon:yes stop_codon:yes gene_type:complete